VVTGVAAGSATITGTYEGQSDSVGITVTATVTSLTDSNFSTAVDLWFSDEVTATSTYGHISNWDVSAVTDMSEAFSNQSSFNEDISLWDVRNVTTMGTMFYAAASFNGDISSWDISSVTNMNSMFYNAESFNQDLSGWCVTNIASEPGNFDTGATSWFWIARYGGRVPDLRPMGQRTVNDEAGDEHLYEA